MLDLGLREGGEGGSDFGKKLGYYWSPDTILRIIKQAPLPEYRVPEVVGVDDFAFRRCHRYGTIIVDLEARRSIALLPDRRKETLQAWFEEHPGIKTISRDRAGPYAKAAAAGAPQAQQVADRWHLMKNLGDALERMLNRYPKQIRKAYKKALMKSTEQGDSGKKCAQPSQIRGPKAKPVSPAQERRIAKYKQIHRLLKKNESIRSISRRLHLTRKTVRKYAHANRVPEFARHPFPDLLVTPYLPHLNRRWKSGCHNAAQLFREIKGQGYPGSQVTVRSFLQTWRTDSPRIPAPKRIFLPKIKMPSTKYLARLMTRPREKMDQDLRIFLETLFELTPQMQTAAKLGRQFMALLRERRHDLFTPWNKLVDQSNITELKHFAYGLLKDRNAVLGAMKSKWSNGQTEGQVNRLKLMKRSMYGRAGFHLLEKRFLLQSKTTA